MGAGGLDPEIVKPREARWLMASWNKARGRGLDCLSSLLHLGSSPCHGTASLLPWRRGVGPR